MRVLITRRVWGHLEGTGLFQGERHSHPEARSFMAEVLAARVRADGSMTVELTPGEIGVLRGYALGLEQVGRDMAWDPDGRADLAAARALLRHIGQG